MENGPSGEELKGAEQLSKIRASLNAAYNWPCDYMFKFILPNQPEAIDEVLSHFPAFSACKRRESSGGKYISLTITEMVDGPDRIFTCYAAVSALEGVMAL
jgi:putative lipoic acid-binding regulatory protein